MTVSTAKIVKRSRRHGGMDSNKSEKNNGPDGATRGRGLIVRGRA